MAEGESVESQIVWCNVDEEAMRQDFTRLNSSCSPQFVSPGMAALLAHGADRCSGSMKKGAAAQQCASPDRNGGMDRRLSSGATVKSEAAPSDVLAEGAPRSKTGASAGRAGFPMVSRTPGRAPQGLTSPGQCSPGLMKAPDTSWRGQVERCGSRRRRSSDRKGGALPFSSWAARSM